MPAKFLLEHGDARVQASVAENQGACRLARCQIRVLCQKAVQSQRIFPVA